MKPAATFNDLDSPQPRDRLRLCAFDSLQEQLDSLGCDLLQTHVDSSQRRYRQLGSQATVPGGEAQIGWPSGKILLMLPSIVEPMVGDLQDHGLGLL